MNKRHLVNRITAVLAFGALAIPRAIAAPEHSQLVKQLPGVVEASDVVVLGQVLRVHAGFRRNQGGCSPVDGSALPLLDVSLRVEHVYTGVVAADTIAVSCLHGVNGADSRLVLGSKVLVWGYYECADAGRLWGAYALGDPGSGDLHYKLYGGSGSGGAPAVFSGADMDALEASGAFSNRNQAFREVATIALLEVQSTRRSGGKTVFTCRKAGTLLGEDQNVPTNVESPTDPACDIRIHGGDTLAVPILKAELGTHTKHTSLCLTSLLLHNGTIRYFGASQAAVRDLFLQRAGDAGFSLKSGSEKHP